MSHEITIYTLWGEVKAVNISSRSRGVLHLFMSKRVEIEARASEKVRKFVNKNWPVAVGIVGAAGVVGAAVWLTARYLRQKKRRDVLFDQGLEQIEYEVQNVSNEPAALLESGSYLGKLAGVEGAKAVDELANSAETEELKEALSVLKEVMSMRGK